MKPEEWPYSQVKIVTGWLWKKAITDLFNKQLFKGLFVPMNLVDMCGNTHRDKKNIQVIFKLFKCK